MSGAVPYRERVPPSTASRPALRLTRRGRLVRSALVLLLIVLLVAAVVTMVRALAGPEPVEEAPEHSASLAAPSDGGGASPAAASSASASPTPESEGGDSAGAEELHRSGDEGDGTWTVAAPAQAEAPTEGIMRTYAVRVENGLDIDAEAAAAEIAEVLADERGWQVVEEIVFHQLADPAEAEMTISIGSPPTVDELCLPARTGGLWSCRIGPDVALNSDRWLHATPTYDDLAEYRAYMINHEVGHFLGHGHARCGGEGEAAPVMLQQSIDLEGCLPNAWPTTEG